MRGVSNLIITHFQSFETASLQNETAPIGFLNANVTDPCIKLP